MTKERRLAIELWEGIKDAIKLGVISNHASMVFFKKSFCKQHNLSWNNLCWFCTYVHCFPDCPLLKSPEGYFNDTCRATSCLDYWIASNQTFNAKSKQLDKDGNFKLELRLQACDNIIKALKGGKNDRF